MLLTTILLIFAADGVGEASADAPKPPKEKLICEREVPVGSLIARRKVCLTSTQWRKRREDGAATSYKLMMDNMGRSGGGVGAACTQTTC